jgi:serine/threonine-protein kinase
MRRLKSRLVLVLAMALVPLASVPEAQAADPVAESMFQQALQMMRDGKFDDAKRSLDASHKLEPKSGTLLVLGSCNEQLGLTATAWAQYKEAAGLARAEGRTDHVSKATELAKALEPRLSKLRIDAQRMQGGVQLVVKLDGNVVLDGQLGVAFAIDPGEHVVTASAPGRVDWTSKLRIESGKESEIVAVPELDPAPPSAAPVAPQPGPAPSPIAPPPAPIADDGSVGPAWAFVVGGAGVALGAVAIGFGIDQRMVADELDEKCGDRRAACPNDYDFEGARDREVRDFGLFLGLGVAGLGGITAGVIGLVVPPSDTASTAARLDIGPGSATIVGRF